MNPQRTFASAAVSDRQACWVADLSVVDRSADVETGELGIGVGFGSRGRVND